jgi:Fic family protein
MPPYPKNRLQLNRLVPCSQTTRQDIQYAEDLGDLPRQDEIAVALQRIWERPIRKHDIQGIHGTLFYQLQHYKNIYREKREDAVERGAINAAQRRLFGIP